MLKVGARVHDYGRDTPEAVFSRIAADGYEAVMLAFQKAIAGVTSYYDVTPELIAQTKTALSTNGLDIRTLGVYMELGMVDEIARKQAVEQFLCGLKVAQQMGIPTVATETTPMHKQHGVTREAAYASLEKSMGEILPVAEELGVQVCVEPVFYHSLATPELARQLLNTMKSPNLKITFDPVNLLDVPEVPTQHDLWKRAFDAFGAEIEVVHMKAIRVENGKLEKADFATSVVDYPYLFEELKKLRRPLHIIREEVKPEHGKEDCAFLKQLCAM